MAWLEIPCPDCGEFALEAEIVLRDVTLRVRPQEGGSVAVDVLNADAQMAAAVCQACGEEVDPNSDDHLADALEDAAEAWLSRQSE